MKSEKVKSEFMKRMSYKQVHRANMITIPTTNHYSACLGLSYILCLNRCLQLSKQKFQNMLILS